MGNVSEILKETRINKGLTIEQVEAATSIRRIYIVAIENGEFSKVPGEVFVKGIIRTYGNYLGLNGVELVDAYKAEYSSDPRNTTVSQPIRVAEKISVSPQFKPEKVSSVSNFTYVVILVLVLAVAGGVAFFMNSETTDSEAVAVNQTKIEEPVKPEVVPSQEPVKVYDGVDLIMKCNDKCWVEVTADGKNVFQSLLTKGQEQHFNAKETIVVKYGNVSVMDITVNGELLPKDNSTKVVVRTYTK